MSAQGARTECTRAFHAARGAIALLWFASGVLAAASLSAAPTNATTHTNATPRREVRFYVASGAAPAARAVVRLYEQRHPGVRIVVRAESASRLARDILIGGAEPDAVLFDAPAPFADLVARGILAIATRTPLFSDDVVLASAANGPRYLGSLRELGDLDTTGIAPLALCDSTDPAGAAAYVFLEEAALWTAMQARAIRVPDGGAAAAAVETGAAAFAFVPRASIRNSARARVVWSPAPSPASTIDYTFALVRRSERRREAIDFHRFLISSAAARIFASYGFSPPALAAIPR